MEQSLQDQVIYTIEHLRTTKNRLYFPKSDRFTVLVSHFSKTSLTDSSRIKLNAISLPWQLFGTIRQVTQNSCFQLYLRTKICQVMAVFNVRIRPQPTRTLPESNWIVLQKYAKNTRQAQLSYISRARSLPARPILRGHSAGILRRYYKLPEFIPESSHNLADFV